MSQPDDVHDVRQMERSGRPLASQRTTPRQKQRLLQAFKRALREGDERRFMEAIRRDLGLKDGTPEFQRAVELWRKSPKGAS